MDGGIMCQQKLPSSDGNYPAQYGHEDEFRLTFYESKANTAL